MILRAYFLIETSGTYTSNSDKSSSAVFTYYIKLHLQVLTADETSNFDLNTKRNP